MFIIHINIQMLTLFICKHDELAANSFVMNKIEHHRLKGTFDARLKFNLYSKDL